MALDDYEWTHESPIEEKKNVENVMNVNNDVSAPHAAVPVKNRQFEIVGKSIKWKFRCTFHVVRNIRTHRLTWL